MTFHIMLFMRSVEYQLICLEWKYSYIMLNVYVRHWSFHIMFLMRSGTWATFVSGIIHKNNRVMIICRWQLHTPENRKKYENGEAQCQEPGASNLKIGPKPQQYPICCTPPHTSGTSSQQLDKVRGWSICWLYGKISGGKKGEYLHLNYMCNSHLIIELYPLTFIFDF